jgi:hypothetical protein
MEIKLEHIVVEHYLRNLIKSQASSVQVRVSLKAKNPELLISSRKMASKLKNGSIQTVKMFHLKWNSSLTYSRHHLLAKK